MVKGKLRHIAISVPNKEGLRDCTAEALRSRRSSYRDIILNKPSVNSVCAPCANFLVARGYPKRGFARAKTPRNAKSGSLIFLRPLRLCGR